LDICDKVDDKLQNRRREVEEDEGNWLKIVRESNEMEIIYPYIHCTGK
jgi:hypothetical protein